MIIAPHIILGDRPLDLPISKANKGFYIQILTKIDDQLRAMLSHHCKVLVFRVDLHLHNQSNDNQVMTTFIMRYRKRLQKGLGLSRVGYVWCREQDKANQHHYHLAVMVDGNKHQRAGKLISLIKYYWDELHIGKTTVVEKCYVMVGRDSEEAYQMAFERICYLAKVYSKSPNQRNASANDYEGSRIKCKASK